MSTLNWQIIEVNQLQLNFLMKASIDNMENQ